LVNPVRKKKQILEAVRNKILAIEHIGSTAVLGLGAKPINDIIAGVHIQIEADECLTPLKKIGYTDVTPAGTICILPSSLVTTGTDIWVSEISTKLS